MRCPASESTNATKAAAAEFIGSLALSLDPLDRASLTKAMAALGVLTTSSLQGLAAERAGAARRRLLVRVCVLEV